VIEERIAHDALRIDYPVKEELLAAAEYALEWFEEWDEHAPDECVFGGEYKVMKRLRQAVQLARVEDEGLSRQGGST
jgi:hypothetical protein